MTYEIRDATSADAESIARYNSAMASETEGRPLDPATIRSGVAALLDDRTKGRYWVAESDGEIVGQLMVTYEWSDWRNGTLWWIQSVYVNPEIRRQGVFSALYRHVESLASRAPDVCGLRLYVERDNRRAQKTYESLGMVSPNYLVMESMFD
ncbi:MAG: GNAT family N-acetyltransferase [Gammaproteobacteria bacterium]|nr:GNAT family N-acetyltransferase [Gammaproteobacteria bacterium]